MNKEEILNALNSFKVVKTNIEEDNIQVLVESSEENLSKLEELGLSREDILAYSEGNLFCIFSLGVDYTDANCWDGEKLVVNEDKLEIEDEEEEYYTDYPNEPIGGGNPYYCCSYCRISDPQINGRLEGHWEHCEYRIEKEKKLKKKK